MINVQIYKSHIKPIKPQKLALIKPIKPAGLGFMIKPGFCANPDRPASETPSEWRFATAVGRLWPEIG